MRQLIIARKDLQMSPGKLAAQCCHASLAFLTDPIGMGQGVEPIEKDGEMENTGKMDSDFSFNIAGFLWIPEYSCRKL